MRLDRTNVTVVPDTDTLQTAPRQRIRWLQRLTVAGVVGAVALLLALVWAMLPARPAPVRAASPAVTRASGDACARRLIEMWSGSDPELRYTSDEHRRLLLVAAEGCSSDQPGLVESHLLRIDDGKLELQLHGVTEDFATPDYLAQARTARPLGQVIELSAPSGRFTDRLHPVPVSAGRAPLVLVQRYTRAEGAVSAVGVPKVPSGAPPAVRQVHWLLSALALGLVALVGVSLRWLGRSQRDYQQTLQESVRNLKEVALKLEKEAQARQDDIKFRLDIEESISVGLRVIDREGQLIHVNRAFCKDSGLSPDTLIGMRAPYLFWPDDPAQVKKLDERLRKILDGEEERGHYDATYVRPDGTRWEAQVSARRLDSGKGWIFTSTDVTREVEDQRRIESLNEQLLKEITDHKAAALKLEKAAQFRLDIEESISVGLRVIDNEGKITHVNDAFCKDSGLSVKDLVDTRAPYPFWPVDQADTLGQHLRDILNGKAEQGSYRATYKRLDGTPWRAQVDAHRLRSKDGWIFTSIDVTSEEEAQKHLAAMNEQQQATRQINYMGLRLGGLLHKLSNHSGAYTTAIDGLTKHLKAGHHDSFEQGVGIAERAALDMAGIIDKYRDVLRKEAAKEPALLHETVADAMLQVSSYAVQHNVVMDNAVSKALPPVLMERRLLWEVLSNLLHNAISAMVTPPALTSILNRRISISDYLDDDAGQVQIRVRDRGPGVPAALREQIFAQGFTTRPGGTGWGLYSSRLWVEEVGGSLVIEDNLPRGADFVITLPFSTSTEDAPAHDVPTPPVT